MSIRSDITKFVSKIENKGTSILSGLVSQLTAFKDEAAAVAAGIFDGDVTGISATEIPNMKTAIITYVDNVEKALDAVVAESDPAKAFADTEMQTACTTYLQAIADACKAYTSQLLKFHDTLSEIYDQYTANQATMNSNLATEAQNMATSVERYNVQS